MNISSEWGLLRQIKDFLEKHSQAPPGLVHGIGDDCAVFSIGPHRYGLITTDISIENIHFRRDLATPEDIGYKAMIGNISDISAMGAEPRYAFVSLGITRDTDDRYVESIYRGMISACAAGLPCIAGGDISRSDNLIINIALYGEAEKASLITRSGACAGDHIYCTGTLGDSSAGLEILMQGNRSSKNDALINSHLRPPCRQGMVSLIRDRYGPSAMIDISDGLLSDIRHVCEASGTGFVIDHESIPLSPALRRYAAENSKDPVSYALRSGEEYELLFTAPGHDHDPLRDKRKSADCPVTRIGLITDREFTIKKRGVLTVIPIEGYDHFM